MSHIENYEFADLTDKQNQTLDIASSGIALRSLFSNACLLKMYDGFRKESLHKKIDDARIFSNRTTK